MSNIKKIKNINGDDIYPITVVDAIYTSDGSKLSESINELDNSIEQIYSLIDSYDKANEDLIISIKKILDDAGIEYNENESLSSLLNKVILNTSGGGSGTVYIEGGPVTRTNSADTFNYVGGGSLAMLYVDITDLDFTPTLLVASSVDSNGVVIMTIILSYDAYYKKLTVKAEYNGNGKTGAYYSYHFLADSVVLRPDGTIRLPVPNDITLTSFNYYAVGEGKSGGSGSGGGLNIISATELPAKGEENQICVITENPVDSFMITPLISDYPESNDTIGIITDSTNVSTPITYTNGNVIHQDYISKIVQNKTRLESHIYRNGNWSILTNTEHHLLKNGYLNDDALVGTFSIIETSDWTSLKYGSGNLSYGFRTMQSGKYEYGHLTNDTPINFSNFTKIIVECTATSIYAAYGTTLRVGATTVANGHYSYSSSVITNLFETKQITTNTSTVYEIDCSNVTDADGKYLAIELAHYNTSTVTFTLKNVYMY